MLILRLGSALLDLPLVTAASASAGGRGPRPTAVTSTGGEPLAVWKPDPVDEY